MMFRSLCLTLGLFSTALFSHGQISKGHQILIDRGFQIQGMVSETDPFHLSTYTNANYSSISLFWNPAPSYLGPAPGFLWTRWAGSQADMPPLAGEEPYMSQLVTLQLADEWELNNDEVRTTLVDWFNAVRANYPNTILFHNNYGGQVGDAQLYDFYTRAQPDMLSFDAYPFRLDGSGNKYQTLINWYSDMRRFRQHAMGANIPLATYLQTFGSSSENVSHPSPSELHLQHSISLAFNCKVLIDFTYNTGASSLFDKTFGGDNAPTSLYYDKANAALRAQNFGKTLVRLKPVADVSFPDLRTTGIMFIRGRTDIGAINPFPIGFYAGTGGADPTTDWAYQRHDPYLTNNWVVTNKGTKNNGQPGDVIISWFRPMDESFDGPEYSNEVYMMVVNGLSDLTGTGPECLQEIKLNFASSLTAVEMLNPLTGLVEVQPLPLTNGFRQLVLNLNGGHAALFKFSDGAPFIGAALTGPPVITAQPANQFTTAGGNATFTSRAAGAATLSYQWKFNGTNITGATTNNYTRTNVQALDTGTYTLVISNSFGSVTSSPVALGLVTLPTIQTHPQSRTNNGGTTATFSVAASGNGLNYQWRRGGTNVVNGGNISGATSESLTISPVSRSDAASYSVIISNAAGTVTSSTAVMTVLFPFPWNEPFNYTAGINIAGQISPSGLTWTDVGTSTAGPHVTVQSGNLAVTNLASAAGNSLRFGGLGKSARLSFPSAVTSGTVYFSCAVKVSNLTGASATGGLLAGFNNSTGTQANQPSVVAPRIYLRTAGDGYNLGVAKNSDTDWFWDSTVFSTNETVFLVGSYTFTSTGNSTDDIAKLWINPNSSSFAAATPPAPTLTATTGNDITANQIASFVFFQRSATAQPAVIIADDLRISTNWVGVTPTPIPPRVNSITLLSDGRIQFQGTAEGGTVAIEGSTNLVNWSEITNVTIANGSFEYAESTTNLLRRFYRLKFTP